MDWLANHLIEFLLFLVSNIGSIVYFGYKSGRLEQRVIALEQGLPEIKQDLREIRQDVKSILSQSNR